MADDLVTHLVLDGVGTYMRGLSKIEYGLNAGAKAADDFRKRTERISQAAEAVGNVGTKMALAGVGILAGVGAVANVAAQFDKAMRNVNSIAKLTEVQFQSLRKEVLALAGDPLIVDGPTQLAEGLYQIQSSGYSGAMALKVLEVSAKGGAAGMSDTATAAKALTGIMNAYNQKTGPDAKRIMDILFKTVELGVVEFDELAQSIGPATAIAAQAGVPLEHLAAAITVMTRSGNDANMTITSLVRIMTAFLNTPPELAAAMEEYTTETGASIMRTKGLAGAIEILGKIAGKNPEVLAQIGLEARALRGAMALTGTGAVELATDLENMANVAGAAEAAATEQAKAQTRAWEELTKQLKILAIVFGDFAAGPISNMVKKVVKLTGKLAELPDWLKKAIVYLVGGAGLALALTGTALKLAAVTVQTWLSIQAMRAYIGALQAERAAALAAAEANATLGASRAAAAAGAGAAGAGAGAAGAVGGGIAAGGPIGVGVLIGIMILASMKSIQAAWRMKKFREEMEQLRDPIDRANRVLEELEWVMSDPGAQMLLGTKRMAQVVEAAEKLRKFIASGGKPAAETALATQEQTRQAAIKASKASAEELAYTLALVTAMEKAGAASAAQSYMARAALLQNLIDQWAVMTEAERASDAGRKLQLAAWSLMADQVNAKEQARKDLLDAQTKAILEQTQAIQQQLGLLDARVGYAQAYAEYLEATGQRGLARKVRREAVPFLQRQAAAGAFGAMQQYGARGMWTEALQAGAQGWRYGGEAATAGRGGGGRSSLTVSPNWSFDRLQRDQDTRVQMQSSAGNN